MRQFVCGLFAGAASVTMYVAWRVRRRNKLDVPFKSGEFGLGEHSCKGGAVFTVRVATRRDTKMLLGLIQGLATFEKVPLSTVEVTESDLLDHGFGPRPLFRALLAEGPGGDPAAVAIAYDSYSTWQGPCVYLEDLFVCEKYRGAGLGKIMLKTVAAMAYAKGCKRMHWNALDWNTPAIDFYEKIGAKVLKEWVTLRMYRPDIEKLLSL